MEPAAAEVSSRALDWCTEVKEEGSLTVEPDVWHGDVEQQGPWNKHEPRYP